MTDQPPNDTTIPLPGDKFTSKGKRHTGSRWNYFRRELEVDEVHINYAMPADSHACMIAEAIKEQIPGAIKIAVDIATIRWTDTLKNRRIICLTPRKAQTALVSFDQGVKPEPFRFILEAIQITQTKEQIRHEGLFERRTEKTPQARRTREGRQLPKEQRPRNPDIIGSAGKPRRGQIASALRNRETDATQLRMEAFKEVGPRTGQGRITRDDDTKILADMVIHGGKEPPGHKASRKRAFGLKGFTWDNIGDGIKPKPTPEPEPASTVIWSHSPAEPTS